jgi:small subunit ribosomal protein S24e
MITYPSPPFGRLLCSSFKVDVKRHGSDEFVHWYARVCVWMERITATSFSTTTTWRLSSTVVALPMWRITDATFTPRYRRFSTQITPDSKEEHKAVIGRARLRNVEWKMLTMIDSCSDILHPNRANISKDELREKLGGLYKAQKDQISVFGLRTQFGGGKTTGFALVYDSPEAMKKFEPLYRLVRFGLGTKVERASRQQRKQRKNRQKTLRGTAKVKGAKAKKEK